MPENEGRLITKQLDLFSKPHMLNTIENKIFINYKPISPITSEFCALEFQIPANTIFYTDLSNTWLALKIGIVKENGTPLEEEDQVCPANLILHSLFSQIDVSLNQQLISTSVGNNYSYQAMFQVLDEANFQNRNSYLMAEGYTKESNFKAIDNSLNYTFNHSKVLNGGVIHLQGRLRDDLSRMKRVLPNGLEIRYRLIQALNTFRINAVNPKTAYKIVIHDASLNVCHLKLTSEQLVRHGEMFSRGPALFPYDRTEIKTFQLAANSYSVQLENLFSNALPKRLLICFVPSESYSGKYNRDSFYFYHNFVNYIELTKDGNSINGGPLRINFAKGDFLEPYLKLIKDNEKIAILASDYPDGYSMFSFDLQNDIEVDGVKTSPMYGNLRLNISFQEPLIEGVTLIIQSIYSDSFEIDQVRNIIQT